MLPKDVLMDTSARKEACIPILFKTAHIILFYFFLVHAGELRTVELSRSKNDLEYKNTTHLHHLYFIDTLMI
uniref:Uncharacterized protein n=1 Tax=Arundo donax TaxID=35708 RepID=A0A0A9HK55_ARUDO